VWNPFFAARGLNRRRRRSGSPWGVSVREEGARLEEVYPERKLCHVPCVIVAVAGADTVSVPVPRLPATGTRSGVHSRPSWGFLTSKIVPKDVPSVGHRMPPGSIAPRTLRSWGRWSLASDVTSLQSIEGESAVPRRTCSRGVHLTAGLGGEALLAQSFSSPAGHRCGSLVVPRALLGLTGCPVDPRGYRLSAVLVVRSPRGD
jgi:hypothetical protein